MFNVLNNKIVHSEQQEAHELQELTRLIRANLDISCQLAVTLGDELDFVNQYVKVEQQLLSDDFDFHIHIAPDVYINKVKIPSMFVQILVENAFVHGLRGWEGHKQLDISVERRQKMIRIAVCDNGPGFDIRSVGRSKRTGLSIITQTVAIVNERNRSKMSFAMTNRKDEAGNARGCEAVIMVPDDFRLDF